MKRIITIILTVVMAAALPLTACSADPDNEKFREIYMKMCGPDEGLKFAKESGAVVFEDLSCTSGKEVWDEFFKETRNGSKTSVTCAYYYTLNEENVSEELLEQEKDQYPVLFFTLLEFDGKEYHIKTRQSDLETDDMDRTYSYLVHLEGQISATGISYDNYVLINYTNVTWEDILRSEFSSQSNARIDNVVVYSDNS